MLPGERAGTSSPDNFIVNKIFRVASKFVRVKKNIQIIFCVRLRAKRNLFLLAGAEEMRNRKEQAVVFMFGLPEL